MFLIFEFGPILPAVLKCLFCIFCADAVYLPSKKLSLFTRFCSNKGFLDVYNVEHPSHAYIDTLKLPKCWKFPLILHLQFCSIFF